jgi:DNA-binding GntR family transcriptional regulator
MPSTWSEVIEQRKVKSLRSLAREYGISYEAIRRALRLANETAR